MSIRAWLNCEVMVKLYLKSIHIESNVREWVPPYRLWEVFNQPEEACYQHENALFHDPKPAADEMPIERKPLPGETLTKRELNILGGHVIEQRILVQT
jgi:hypothetical protein